MGLQGALKATPYWHHGRSLGRLAQDENSESMNAFS